MIGQDRIEVVTSQDVVLVRVAGLARLSNAMLFEEFCADRIERSCRFFIIDLAQCRGMDSTFMGILVGLAQTTSENGATHVCVINASAYCQSLLSMLGIERIIRVVDKPIRLPPLEGVVLEDVQCSDETRLQLVEKAHESLCRLDDRNASQLQAFVEALKAEMAAKGIRKS